MILGGINMEELHELWKPITHLPGFEVSNLGRIRDSKGVIRKIQNHVKGYQFLVISMPVHKLVCEAFHGPQPFPNAMVLHGPDHNKHNNREDNLRWGTAQENSDDMIEAGRANSPKGEEHGRSKLTWEIVKAARARYDAGEVGKQIWREMGEPLGIQYQAFYKMLKRFLWKE